MIFTEKRYAKIIDDKTKEVIVGIGYPDEHYIEIGMTLIDVDLGYNGKYYVSGFAPEQPEPTEDEKKVLVRQVRSQYYETYVDWYQSKPLLWAEMTEEEKTDIANYRIYLKNYTELENWWENNPKTFEEWKTSNL